MIPTTKRIGNANSINPPITRPTRNSGNKTIVQINFEMLHAARRANTANLPNTIIIKIKNMKFNILFPPLNL